MTTMPATSPLDGLRDLLTSRPDETSVGRWRWSVRARMAGVRDLVSETGASPEDGALAPRHLAAERERAALLGRLADLGPRVLESDDVEAVRSELVRLLADVRHHLQRRSDLAWDDVQLDFGGSE